jgi:hypothetical protein
MAGGPARDAIGPKGVADDLMVDESGANSKKVAALKAELL